MVDVSKRYFDEKVKRDEFIKMAGCSYIIPEEFRPYFSEGIKKYANNLHLKEETINKMVAKQQSFAQFIEPLQLEQNPQRQFNYSFSHWKGHFAEWVTCLEYNSLKNKGNVIMTIVNPDTTSKADLLHLIKTKDGYKVVPGPDVKTGQPEYVLSSYESLLKKKIEIPFLDAFGHITTYAEDLTKGQRKRLSSAMAAHPDKSPLPGLISKMDYHRLMVDYLAYVKTGRLPSERVNGDFKLPKTTEKIRELVEQVGTYESIEKKSWEHFRLDLREQEQDSLALQRNSVQIKNSQIRQNSLPSQSISDPFDLESIELSKPRLKGIDEFQGIPINKDIKADIEEKNRILLGYIADIKKKSSKWNRFLNGTKFVSKELFNFMIKEAEHRAQVMLEEQIGRLIGRLIGSITPSLPRESQQKYPHTPFEKSMESSPKDNFGGVGSPKQPHDRREHFRTLRGGRVIPVSSTRVNKGKMDD